MAAWHAIYIFRGTDWIASLGFSKHRTINTIKENAGHHRWTWTLVAWELMCHLTSRESRDPVDANVHHSTVPTYRSRFQVTPEAAGICINGPNPTARTAALLANGWGFSRSSRYSSGLFVYWQTSKSVNSPSVRGWGFQTKAFNYIQPSSFMTPSLWNKSLLRTMYENVWSTIMVFLKFQPQAVSPPTP